MTDGTRTSTFGAEVSKRRSLKGWSRRQLAKRAELSESRLRHIEQGYEQRGGHRHQFRPTLTSVVRLANALGWEPIDEAVRLAGHKPIAGDELAELLEPSTGGYIDVVEQAIWSLAEIPPDERRAWITLLRERRKQAGADVAGPRQPSADPEAAMTYTPQAAKHYSGPVSTEPLVERPLD